MGGGGQLTGGFPRQELQLPTQPPSQHVSSFCFAPSASRPALGHNNAPAEGLKRARRDLPSSLPYEMDNQPNGIRTLPSKVPHAAGFGELAALDGNPPWPSERLSSSVLVLRWERRADGPEKWGGPWTLLFLGEDSFLHLLWPWIWISAAHVFSIVL